MLRHSNFLICRGLLQRWWKTTNSQNQRSSTSDHQPQTNQHLQQPSRHQQQIAQIPHRSPKHREIPNLYQLETSWSITRPINRLTYSWTQIIIPKWPQTNRSRIQKRYSSHTWRNSKAKPQMTEVQRSVMKTKSKILKWKHIKTKLELPISSLIKT